jgi:hypothetical protein
MVILIIRRGWIISHARHHFKAKNSDLGQMDFVLGQLGWGFFAQGDAFEEARENLRDVIEGNVLLALQLDLPIPHIPGVAVKVGISRDEWVRL